MMIIDPFFKLMIYTVIYTGTHNPGLISTMFQPTELISVAMFFF